MRLRRTRVGSASLPQKKGSNSRWKKLISWLGKAAPLNSSRRTRQARCRCSNLMTVHVSESVAICRYLEGHHPEPNRARPTRTGGDREVESPDGTGTVWSNLTDVSKY